MEPVLPSLSCIIQSYTQSGLIHMISTYHVTHSRDTCDMLTYDNDVIIKVLYLLELELSLELEILAHGYVSRDM